MVPGPPPTATRNSAANTPPRAQLVGRPLWLPGDERPARAGTSRRRLDLVAPDHRRAHDRVGRAPPRALWSRGVAGGAAGHGAAAALLERRLAVLAARRRPRLPDGELEPRAHDAGRRGRSARPPRQGDARGGAAQAAAAGARAAVAQDRRERQARARARGGEGGAAAVPRRGRTTRSGDRRRRRCSPPTARRRRCRRCRRCASGAAPPTPRGVRMRSARCRRASTCSRRCTRRTTAPARRRRGAGGATARSSSRRGTRRRRRRRARRRRRELPESLLASARAIFLAHDTDGSGCLDVAELRLVLRVMGLEVPAEKVAAMMATVGVRDSGELEIREFIALLGRYQDELALRRAAGARHQPRALRLRMDAGAARAAAATARPIPPTGSPRRTSMRRRTCSSAASTFASSCATSSLPTKTRSRSSSSRSCCSGGSRRPPRRRPSRRSVTRGNYAASAPEAATAAHSHDRAVGGATHTIIDKRRDYIKPHPHGAS